VESFGNYVCCKNLYLVQPGDAAYTISRHMLPEYCKKQLDRVKAEDAGVSGRVTLAKHSLVQRSRDQG
jgi:hypothetical protein